MTKHSWVIYSGSVMFQQSWFLIENREDMAVQRGTWVEGDKDWQSRNQGGSIALREKPKFHQYKEMKKTHSEISPELRVL
jgi:hypothetical protein